MLLKTIPLLLLLVACNERNKVAREGEDVEAAAPVAIHPDINRRIRYVKHSQRRLPDGRLAIRVVLESRSTKDRPLILRTSWLDDIDDVIEQSDERQVLIPTGGTVVFEDVSWSPRATNFNVAVRAASTKRKR